MKTSLALLYKDLLVGWRGRVRLVGLATYALTLLLLFSFAVGPDTAALRDHASAYLWAGQEVEVEITRGDATRRLTLKLTPAR